MIILTVHELFQMPLGCMKLWNRPSPLSFILKTVSILRFDLCCIIVRRGDIETIESRYILLCVVSIVTRCILFVNILFIIQALPVRLLVLQVFVLVDTHLYGNVLTIAPLRFYAANVSKNYAAYFGVQPWHWNFTQVLPLSFAVTAAHPTERRSTVSQLVQMLIWDVINCTYLSHIMYASICTCTMYRAYPWCWACIHRWSSTVC